MRHQHRLSQAKADEVALPAEARSDARPLRRFVCRTFPRKHQRRSSCGLS